MSKARRNKEDHTMADLNTVQNNEQASKKKSNVLWIVFVALIIIAMAVEGFILFNKGRSAGKEPVDNTSTMTNDEMLESYRGLYPELSDDEILDMFNREMTEEEQKKYEEIVNDPDALPPVAEIIEYTETGYIYKDADGNTHEVIDPYMNMTDDEADAYNEKYSDITAFLPDNTKTGETGAQEQGKITGIPDENTEEPFDGNDDPSLIDKDSRNVYEGAVVEREVTDAGSGIETKDKTYETPSYEIVG